MVANLVIHSCSPSTIEVTHALNILSDISDLETKFEERARSNEIRKRNGKKKNLLLDNDINNNNNNNDNINKIEKNVTLRNFVSFLKTLLEDVSVLNEQHLRVIFKLLFQSTCIAEEKTIDNNNINNIVNRNGKNEIRVWTFSPPDDVMILLKKFSSSVNVKFRRIAAVGYVSYLSQLRLFCQSVLRFVSVCICIFIFIFIFAG